MEQKRYESDMTPKEKMELERKKLKQMTAGQKLEYIWAYYKPHMAVALGIILLIVFIGQMIYRSQFDTVFYAAIINGTAGDGEALAEDFKNYTGDTDKYHEYTIDNSMYLMKDQEDYQMVMKLSTIIGAQQVDVLIAPEWEQQKEKFLKRIYHAYHKAPHFEEVWKDLEPAFRRIKPGDRMIDWNLYFTVFIANKMKMLKPLYYESDEQDLPEDPDDAIIHMCKRTGCDKYLVGVHGNQYMDLEKYKKAGIELVYSDFNKDKDLTGNYLSILDYIMNYGYVIPKEWK